MCDVETIPSNREILGHNLKRFLRLRKIRPAELAQTMGVTKQHVYKMISGTVNPTIDTLEGLTSALDVTIAQLLQPPYRRSKKESGMEEVVHGDHK